MTAQPELSQCLLVGMDSITSPYISLWYLTNMLTLISKLMKNYSVRHLLILNRAFTPLQYVQVLATSLNVSLIISTVVSQLIYINYIIILHKNGSIYGIYVIFQIIPVISLYY